TDITIEDSRFTGSIKEALEEYMEGRAELYTTKKKARSLMDIATLAVKELRHAGGLTNLDESDEINACTIIVPVDVNGKTEEWLLLFKNETHNCADFHALCYVARMVIFFYFTCSKADLVAVRGVT
ncbi:Phosphoribosylformylglycinamidine synthase, partial [human gut metagenome]